MSGDLLPPDTMRLEDAGAAVGGALPVAVGGVNEIDRTFFDTFDGLVRSEGLSCVHEQGRLTLVERETGRERAAAPAPPPTGPLLAESLAPGPLRDALAPVAGVRALLPLVHVHSRMRTVSVLDDERKTVVRITLEEPAVVASSSRHVQLRPRVRLAVVRGYDEELERVRRTLECELGFRPSDQPLVDEAIRAVGGTPAGTSSKIDVALGYNQRSDEAAGRVLHALLEVIVANVDGTVADIDSEFLHDLRVSVRRSRSVQREFEGVFPPAELARFRSEFRWLQQATGEARDLDVYVLEFEDYRELLPQSLRADLEPLLGVLRRRRLGARREMARALRSERAQLLLADWRGLLEQLPGLELEDRPDAIRPIGVLAGERICKVYRRMVRTGGAIDAASPPAAYHELRKKGKELRYLLELFAAPVYPGEVVKPMIKALKALQDVLGRHQDREVQIATLRALCDEVAALPGGPSALMAMGVLTQRLAEDEREARAEFADRFGAFAAKSQRKLVKETFGKAR